tara:strand:+ start:50027 stop:50923 length:897 start_codon:yes stop_codon:yes gene_type:complete
MSYSKQLDINGHAGAVYDCLATNQFIYSASGDKFVVRWFVDSGKQDKFAINFEHSIYSLELIEDRYLFAGLSSGDLHIVDLLNNKEVKFYQQHTVAIFSIKYNKHRSHVYVGDAEGNFSVWDSNSLDLVIYLPLDCGKIRSIAISDNGQNFALACQDSTIRVFETGYFNEIHSFFAHKNGATAVLFHPENPQLIISGGKDALLKIWNWKEEKALKSIVAHTYAIYDLISMEEGSCIISASRDKNLKVWEVNKESLEISERLDFKIGGHKHSVNSLAKISERKFASCSDDKKIIIWKKD